MRRIRRQEKTQFIQENYESVLAIPYDMPIVGYGNHVVNTLRDLGRGGRSQTSSWIPLTGADYHKAVEQENLAKTDRGGALSE